ncbi:MAG: hypothetical protein IPG04_00815 [Polyangiaceae bacterium]|nr:hypothetical protein [Polyangiaceae bacterium]
MLLSSRGRVAVLFLVATACSAGAGGSGGAGAGNDGGNGAGIGEGGSGAGVSEGGSGFQGGSPGTGGGSSDDCSEASKLIYIIGQGNQLYSFAPQTLTVTPIGVVSCPSGGATPFSMAVDRSGTAWVIFSDGHLFTVDVATAACAATSYQPNQQGLSTFGMGFVATTPGSDVEELFVADYFGSGIAALDTSTLTLGPLRDYDQLYTGAELTGTGDARLFGFFQGFPIIISEIDKSSGAILSQAPQPTINIGSGWAFAFWGGDFWLFTNPSGVGSQIDRYRPSDGTTTTVFTGIGDNIVGAGVSTCAPLVPPT